MTTPTTESPIKDSLISGLERLSRDGSVKARFRHALFDADDTRIYPYLYMYLPPKRVSGNGSQSNYEKSFRDTMCLFASGRFPLTDNPPRDGSELGRLLAWVASSRGSNPSDCGLTVRLHNTLVSKRPSRRAILRAVLTILKESSKAGAQINFPGVRSDLEGLYQNTPWKRQAISKRYARFTPDSEEE